MMEIKVDVHKVPKNFYSKYFDKIFCCDPIGRSGGLYLCWNSTKVFVNIISSFPRYITCSMKDSVINLEQVVTSIYAFPQKYMQCGLWEEVLKLNPIYSPWYIIEQLNNIIDLSEKVRGNQTHTTDMNNFTNFLNRGNFLSLNAFGVPFTLTNCHTDHTIVFERLHRVVANPLWLNMFLDYHLHNYPIFFL